MLDISNNSDEHFRFGGWAARLAATRAVAARVAAAARARAAAAARARAAAGSGKGPLKIGQITYKVSSSHDNGRNRHFTPQINSPQGWSAGANNTGQWINMTFPKQFVTNVLTQGRINGAHGQYVREFDLYYKNSSNRWVRIGRKRAGTNNGIVKAPVNKLTHEIQLNIKSWSRHITMRAGVEFGNPVGVYGAKPAPKPAPKKVGVYGAKPAPTAKHQIMKKFTNGARLRLKTWRNNYVRMRHDRNHVHQGGAGTEEIFTVKTLPQFGPNVIALFGFNRRYLRSHNAKRNRHGDYKVDQSDQRPNYNSFPNGWGWERWWVEDVGGGKIALRGYHNRYLRAHSDGWMDTNGTVISRGKPMPSGWQWEKFTPVFIGGAPKPVGVYGGSSRAVAAKVAAAKVAAARAAAKKSASKTAEYSQSSAKLSSVPNISTHVTEIKLSGTDKSVGSTNDLKQPDMTMNPDLKDDTKFELFINGKEINNNSNLWLVILVSLFLIGICNLK